MIAKKPFLTRTFLIASVLFSGIIALYVLAIAGISDEYDTDILTNPEFAENYDKLTEQTEKISTARSSAAAGEGLSFIGTFDVAFQSTFTVIQMVFQSLDLFGGIADTFGNSDEFGLDPRIIHLDLLIGLTILTILIILTWISSISRGRI